MHSDRYVRAADSERNIVSGLSADGEKKKSDDYSTRDRSYVRASISRQRDSGVTRSTQRMLQDIQISCHYIL